jgi:hypothetical protein
MSLDLNKIKSRLNSLSNNNTKSNLVWKPTPGKQVVRIIPYKFNSESPFIELKFHYGLNGKTYLSPDSFNRPDPIVEFSNKLKKSGDKEEWKFGKKIEPKMRTFAPVLVRGQEHEGVKFWGFGKSVYAEILSIISDPDFGDITDLATGRDIVVEFKTVAETNKQFPETTIRVKPNPSPAVDVNNKDLMAKIQNQTDILELFPELSYDELKNIMTDWLNNENGETSVVSSTETDVVAQVATIKDGEESVQPAKQSKSPNKSPSATASKMNDEEVKNAFANLFNT